MRGFFGMQGKNTANTDVLASILTKSERKIRHSKSGLDFNALANGGIKNGRCKREALDVQREK